jgi:hypothetical protein
LVKALDLPFRLRDAFRLGFLGYLFNFIAPGAVGGDLFKAVFIAREQPGRRAAAISSVIVDRLVGLLALLMLASVVFLATGVGDEARHGQFRVPCFIVWAVTIGSTLLSLAFMIPALTDGAFAKRIESIRRVGPLIAQFHHAVRMYRRRPSILLLSLVLSLGVHSLTSVAYYLIAKALPGQAPTLAATFIIAPLSILVGILPVMMNGLGVVEGAMKILYAQVPSGLPAGVVVTAGLGLLVSLTNRLIMILIASIGAIYYLFRRREVAVLIHAAEAGPPAPEPSGAAAAAAEFRPGPSSQLAM